MQYCHTLIPISKEFKPSPAQVQDFLAAMVSLCAIGGESAVVMRTPSSRTRVGMNPFTRQMVSFPMKDRAELPNASAISEAIAGKEAFEIEVSGSGRPKNPPIPIEFDGPYYLAIKCRVSSELCCTSNQQEQLEDEPELPFYGRPCSGVPKLGLFVNPHTRDRITVPDAGCANFWIEFELGKFLFPSFEQHDLQFLNPLIIDEAVDVFGVRFVQGCNWEG
jgi:hypothetical protein